MKALLSARSGLGLEREGERGGERGGGEREGWRERERKGERERERVVCVCMCARAFKKNAIVIIVCTIHCNANGELSLIHI